MKRVVLSVAVVAVLAAALAYYYLVPRHKLPDDLLAAVPADAYGVVHVNVPGVLGSDAYKRLVVERGEADGVARITKLCGFNPLEKLSELVVFARPSPTGKLPRFAFVARGDLPHTDLIECVKKFSGGGESKLKREDIEGVPVVTSSGGGSRAGFIGRDGVVGGDSDSVLAVINTVVGKAQGLSSDAVMRGLYGEVSGGTDVALVARMPDEIRPLLLLFSARVAGGALAPLADVRAVAANMTLAQAKIAGGAVLITGDATKASAIVELGKAQVARVLSIPGINATPAGGVLRSVQMEARGERATITGSIKVSTVEALLELLPALEQLQGVLQQAAAPDAGAPAPQGDPTPAPPDGTAPAQPDGTAPAQPDGTATPPPGTPVVTPGVPPASPAPAKDRPATGRAARPPK